MKRILLAGLFIIFNSSLLTISAQSSFVYLAAGNGTNTYSGDGGSAQIAGLNSPYGVATDKYGNLYIADWYNYRIRIVNTRGIISTFAGNGTQGYSGDGGPATAAEIYSPTGVSADKYGNIYIGDDNSNTVRKVNTNGIITTIAGNGTQGFSGDGGPATAAELHGAVDAKVDNSGNVYIPDWGNQRVRMVNTNGIISTFAGNGVQGYGGDGGPASSAQLNTPAGVAVDSAGNVYIADSYNFRIRKVATNGIITTVAGNGTNGSGGDGGPATAAQLGVPQAVATDAAGNIYIADWLNRRIRMVNTSGTISTIAGNGTNGYSGDGGPATAAEMSAPTGVATFSPGEVYFADRLNERIRLVKAPPAYSLAVVDDTNKFMQFAGSPVTFGGDVFNFGTNSITSYRFNYTVNGGAIKRNYVSSASLASLTGHTFTNPLSWTPTASGNYLVKFWTDSLNGSMANTNLNGDSLYAYYTVPDTDQYKMVMYEDFIQASCDPCMRTSPNVESTLSASTAFCNSCRYHVNWPGTDYMNSETQTPFVGNRVSYYGISFVPNGRMDGTTWEDPATVLPSNLFAEHSIGSPFKITIDTFKYTPINQTYSLTVTVKAFAPVAEHVNMRVVLTVDTIKYATDQSTEDPPSYFAPPIGTGSLPDSWYQYTVNFPQVAEDMMPNPSGTSLSPFATEQTQTISLSWQKDHPWGLTPATYPYDSTFTGEHITVFLQDDEIAPYTYQNTPAASYPAHTQMGALTGYVYQSATAPVGTVLAVEEIAKGVYFNMYPNPTNGNTTIAYKLDKEQNVNIELFNALGEKVYESKQGIVSDGQHIVLLNTAQLGAGMYFVRFSTDNAITVKKLVIQ